MPPKPIKDKSSKPNVDINGLIFKRNSVSDSLERFKNFLNSFIPGQSSLFQLKVRTKKAEELWDEFNKYQTQIIAIKPDENNVTEQFEDCYFEAFALSQTLLEQLNVIENQTDEENEREVNNLNKTDGQPINTSPEPHTLNDVVNNSPTTSILHTPVVTSTTSNCTSPKIVSSMSSQPSPTNNAETFQSYNDLETPFSNDSNTTVQPCTSVSSQPFSTSNNNLSQSQINTTVGLNISNPQLSPSFVTSQIPTYSINTHTLPPLQSSVSNILPSHPNSNHQIFQPQQSLIHSTSQPHQGSIINISQPQPLTSTIYNYTQPISHPYIHQSQSLLPNLASHLHQTFPHNSNIKQPSPSNVNMQQQNPYYVDPIYSLQGPSGINNSSIPQASPQVLNPVQHNINNHANSFYQPQMFNQTNHTIPFQTYSNHTTPTYSHMYSGIPKLEIPNFDGNLEEFPQFYEIFRTLIHDSGLDDILKFHHLQSALKGEAKQVLASLQMTPSNYHVAWQLLKDRYLNNSLLIKKHVSDLFSLQKLDKESATGLRSLLSSTIKHIRALNALQQPTDSWDTLLVHMTASKLDYKTYREWQESTPVKQLPSFKSLIEFLEHRCQVLESIDAHSYQNYNKNNNKIQHPQSSNKQQSSIYSMRHQPSAPVRKPTTNNSQCLLTQNEIASPSPSLESSPNQATQQAPVICPSCQRNHFLFSCARFLRLSIPERIKHVESLHLCLSCLKPNHKTSDCRSSKCKRCSGQHNTLLHPETVSSNNLPNITSQPSENAQGSTQSISANCTSGIAVSNVLLASVLVDLISPNGTTITCKALLDCGSQPCIMSQALSNRLGLKQHKSHHTVVGIGSSKTQSSTSVIVTLKSRNSNYTSTINCLVLPKVTGDVPSTMINLDSFQIPNDIKLADPTFNIPSKVDLIIGAGIFWKVLGEKTLNIAPNLPALRETQFGWIISGEIEDESSSTLSCNLTTFESIDEQLKRFWKLEDGKSGCVYTGEDQICEKLFSETTSRNKNGNYVVKMPLKSNPEVLGDSKESAVKRFHLLEKRLTSNPDLHSQYSEFMQQYEELGHMKQISENDITTTAYYIPHHPVFKESTTTKMRVVFDASAPSSNGISLNDITIVGPTVQEDLFSILLRFRKYNYVFCADLEKMYRQIKLDETQPICLLILWRQSPQEPLKTYRLLTVTYGIGCSAFLATRALLQLSYDVKDEYPEAFESIAEDFYVDDYMAGRNTINEAKSLQMSLIEALKKGGFHIRKWRANHPDLLHHISSDDREMDPTFFIDKDSLTKTLGLIWNPVEDLFEFHFDSEITTSNSYTKRNVLSSISKIFDPLGFIGPVTLKAKIILQKLWKVDGLTWDDEIPEPILNEWKIFKQTLSHIKTIKIPRQITSSVEPVLQEIHGFSDSSEAAYGACLYMKSTLNNGVVKIELITSKSKVAPIKQTSLPRLELCGALLLSELTSSTIKSLKINVDQVYLWTDSTIVLTWLAAPSTHWNTFVANRVAKIQDLTDKYLWKHVSGSENPADIISRGYFPDQLVSSQLWWHGPQWLSLNSDFWPMQVHDTVPDVPEKRKSIITLTIQQSETNLIITLLHSKSSFDKAIRILAYCLKFIKKLKACSQSKSNFTPNGELSSNNNSKLLSIEEIEFSRIFVIKTIQGQVFREEYNDLKRNKNVRKQSKLINLAPFIDENQIIRVGGRLSKANLTPDQKQPIILPKGHKITEMIAYDEHKRLLHAPPQLLLSSIRQKYWPLDGKNLCRRIVHQCTTCFKAKPKGANQIMGDLPRERIEPSRPFFHSGVDFCGPFYIKSRSGRGSITTKCYIALFVCFATKAIHLELVTDLSSDAFLAAYRRFTSRRGKCGHLYSDNGTNFVKGNKDLKLLYEALLSETHSKDITQQLTKDNTQWHFIPVYSPTFGGLWEAGVKTIKYHIVRVIQNTKLTFEEFYTVLTQIESCVNSRPLFPESNDPNDFSSLSPSHFLIGEATTAIPEPNLIPFPENRLSRWQYIQQLQQHFWKRWSREYLVELQRRTKWKTETANIPIDTLVLIKDDNLPPTKWQLGRVIQTHTGTDGAVRVVSIKTQSGITKRGINKICPLPIEP